MGLFVRDSAFDPAEETHVGDTIGYSPVVRLAAKR